MTSKTGCRDQALWVRSSLATAPAQTSQHFERAKTGEPGRRLRHYVIARRKVVGLDFGGGECSGVEAELVKGAVKALNHLDGVSFIGPNSDW